MDPNVKDKDQNTALTYAMTKNSQPKIKLLLDYKASTDQNFSLWTGHGNHNKQESTQSNSNSLTS